MRVGEEFVKPLVAGGVVTFSLERIGVWRIAIVGFVLEVGHILLQSSWPSLSPHSPVQRPVWLRIFVVAEYCILLLTLGVAISSISKLIAERQVVKNVVAKVAAIVVGMAAYLVLFAWAWR